MKKILVVVDSIDVNDSSGSKCNVALIENLAYLNYAVTVIHNSNITLHFENCDAIKVNFKTISFNYFFQA